jgi:hypothetical protein
MEFAGQQREDASFGARRSVDPSEARVVVSFVAKLPDSLHSSLSQRNSPIWLWHATTAGYAVTMAKTEPLTVRFSPREYELLSRAARVEDRSRGAVVRRLVDQLEPPDDVRDSTAVEDR